MDSREKGPKFDPNFGTVGQVRALVEANAGSFTFEAKFKPGIGEDMAVSMQVNVAAQQLQKRLQEGNTHNIIYSANFLQQSLEKDGLVEKSTMGPILKDLPPMPGSSDENQAGSPDSSSDSHQ